MHAARELHQPPNLIPWFLVYKPKPGFISNCVPISICLPPPLFFCLPNWNAIFLDLLQGRWARKIGSKHACIHLALCPGAFQLSNRQSIFPMPKPCFGLHYIPYLWTQLMKPFLSKWRKADIVVFINLDDIIVLGPSRERSYVHRRTVLIDWVA